MKIPFQKISNQDVFFELKNDDLKFFGNLKRKNSKLVSCKAKIVGSMPHGCDRCGDDMILILNEDLDLIISDGICNNNENLEDIIEFFDNQIDMEYIFTSEIEAYKSDYFYCKKCKNL